MSKPRDVRCYDYVNHPYEQVRDALTKDAGAVFQAATRAASARAKSVASALHVDIAGFDVAKDVTIGVKKIAEHPAEPKTRVKTVIELEWEAAEAAGLFPLMHGELSVYPLTGTETQLDFFGHYQPPMGALGTALDAVAGHRLAEASVLRFLRDVARFLRESLR